MTEKNPSQLRQDDVAVRTRRDPLVVRVRPNSARAELVEERRADLRERRAARREDRGYRREGRLTNPTGVAGFAVGATTLLLLLGSWLFARSLPGYVYAAAALALPAAVTGLALSVVGALLRGRPKDVALAGIVVGAPLLLFVVPFSFRLPGLLR